MTPEEIRELERRGVVTMLFLIVIVAISVVFTLLSVARYLWAFLPI